MTCGHYCFGQNSIAVNVFWLETKATHQKKEQPTNTEHDLMLLGLVSGFIYTSLSGNNRKLRRCTCEERDQRLLVVKLQVHEPGGLTSADRFTATRCFCIRPRAQTSAPLHVYPITANDLPRTCEGSGISLNSSARSLLLLIKLSSFLGGFFGRINVLCSVAGLQSVQNKRAASSWPVKTIPPAGSERASPAPNRNQSGRATQVERGQKLQGNSKILWLGP